MADVSNPFAAKKVASRITRSRGGGGNKLSEMELREKCDRLEVENAKLKKRVNDLRKATASTTRVVKAATVGQAPKDNLPPIKSADPPTKPEEDASLLHAQIAELRQRVEDSEDGRRIDKVQDPTAWTITRYDGPNHLGF